MSRELLYFLNLIVQFASTRLIADDHKVVAMVVDQISCAPSIELFISSRREQLASCAYEVASYLSKGPRPNWFDRIGM